MYHTDIFPIGEKQRGVRRKGRQEESGFREGAEEERARALMYDVDENGNLVYYPDNSDYANGSENSGEENSNTEDAGNQNADNNISGNDSDLSGFMDFLQLYSQYSELNGEIEPFSLGISNSSYLSTTQLDLFDRILEGDDYRYYIAYRTGSDQYGAVLYACNKAEVSGSTIKMEKPMQFQLYRTYSGNQYYYYYTHSQLNADSVTLNGNSLYYTNIVEGYPLLAGQGRKQLDFSKTEMIAFGIFLLILIVILARRRTHV